MDRIAPAATACILADYWAVALVGDERISWLNPCVMCAGKDCIMCFVRDYSTTLWFIFNSILCSFSFLLSNNYMISVEIKPIFPSRILSTEQSHPPDCPCLSWRACTSSCWRSGAGECTVVVLPGQSAAAHTAPCTDCWNWSGKCEAAPREATMCLHEQSEERTELVFSFISSSPSHSHKLSRVK